MPDISRTYATPQSIRVLMNRMRFRLSAQRPEMVCSVGYDGTGSASEADTQSVDCSRKSWLPGR